MPTEPILVCGAGLMGHGIAQVFAAAGHQVTLYEPELDRAQAGRDRIAANLARAVDRERMTAEERNQALARVQATDDLATAATIALAVEAVYEDVAIKTALLAELDRIAPADAVLASNTSSIPITTLAGAVGESRRPKVVGMHFFSPVPVMPLIELVRGQATSSATEAAVRGWSAELGKQVIVSQDRPGFIVNRILMPYLAEAMRALEEGVGTADDIDTGARVGLNHPMGPLELADFIGLDTCLSIMNVLVDGYGQPHMAPPQVLRDLVAAGRLGQKTGQGFHTYPRPPR
ncbi:MAG: 3-hydroxyacyl-CoA dehydrogenase NAD-binding domain-containing protein [Candidatus Limnocylindrales bacterium]